MVTVVLGGMKGNIRFVSESVFLENFGADQTAADLGPFCIAWNLPTLRIWCKRA